MLICLFLNEWLLHIYFDNKIPRNTARTINSRRSHPHYDLLTIVVEAVCVVELIADDACLVMPAWKMPETRSTMDGGGGGGGCCARASMTFVEKLISISYFWMIEKDTRHRSHCNAWATFDGNWSVWTYRRTIALDQKSWQVTVVVSLALAAEGWVPEGFESSFVTSSPCLKTWTYPMVNQPMHCILARKQIILFNRIASSCILLKKIYHC